MQLNKTTDYAVRILMFLSTQEGVVTSEKISDATKVSKNYIRSILRKLSAAGILKMTRGTNGGYQLAGSEEDISLYDVLSIMEPTMKMNPCLEDKDNCSLFATGTCPVRRFYSSLQEQMEQSLKSTTIKSLKSHPGGGVANSEGS
ncbi:MAG: Rrf2 family transcriptional regulator [Coriobacteriaceae bacterium]|nr:Rrf2 family transcriptional regulator [Coriobacteriaceae bacterium]